MILYHLIVVDAKPLDTHLRGVQKINMCKPRQPNTVHGSLLLAKTSLGASKSSGVGTKTHDISMASKSQKVGPKSSLQVTRLEPPKN